MQELDKKTYLFEAAPVPSAVIQLAVPTILSSLVMVLLEGEKETRGYFINTAASYHLAMCSGAYLEEDDRVIKQNISKEGLSGRYDIKILVEDTKYQTGVSLFC